MFHSIFSVLTDICHEFDHAVRALEPGPVQERFAALVARLDEACDLTVGEEAQRIALQATAQQYITFVETCSIDLGQVEAMYHAFKQALDEEEETR
jgi:hypothetical protein